MEYNKYGHLTLDEVLRLFETQEARTDLEKRLFYAVHELIDDVEDQEFKIESLKDYIDALVAQKQGFTRVVEDSA